MLGAGARLLENGADICEGLRDLTRKVTSNESVIRGSTDPTSDEDDTSSSRHPICISHGGLPVLGLQELVRHARAPFSAPRAITIR